MNGRATAVAFIVLALAMFMALGLEQRRQASDRIDAEVKLCENAKLDRVDNARAWTEMERYLDRISRHGSNPGVRRTAQVAQVRVAESANQLRARLWRCRPLVEDGELEIDERLLLEARGEL